jgi:glycosyltransferase involved in cell wall biosynthesis
VLEQHPNAVCVLAGEGKEQRRLQELIAERALERNVRLHGFEKDPLSLIHAADLFVLPSVCEPLGLVILEAMAVGCPVVAANAGGPAELIADNNNGRLFTPDDSCDLAKIITSMLSDKIASRSLATQGLKFVKNFSAREMATQTLSVYQSVITPDRRGVRTLTRA